MLWEGSVDWLTANSELPCVGAYVAGGVFEPGRNKLEYPIMPSLLLSRPVSPFKAVFA